MLTCELPRTETTETEPPYLPPVDPPEDFGERDWGEGELPQRINVAINADEWRAFSSAMEQAGVDVGALFSGKLTKDKITGEETAEAWQLDAAFHLLAKIGNIAYTAAKIDGEQLLLVTPTQTREVIIL
ncbi:MAG TPA: hypothetical protein VJR27_02550 [Candidatus Saccharimonadales bacterium]|nr:hypothetical protein [Candidatus Saccharimonadales bacterium]